MTILVAICGVDGSGKSTLCRSLADRFTSPRAAHIAKERRTSVDLLSRYGFETSDPRRNWISGPFAQSIAIATVFDFMYHYDQVILPAIETYDFIICDRYKLCYQAYMQAVGAEWPAERYFTCVRPADLLIYLDLPASAAVARYAERGGAGEDENMDVIERFGNSYIELLATYNESPVARIDATQTPKAVYEATIAAIEGHAHKDA